MQAVNFELQPNTRLFSGGGISPAGECWVSPTDIFLRVWKSPTGKHLKKQGFRLRNNGKQCRCIPRPYPLLPAPQTFGLIHYGKPT